jgi:hypothetical protein
MRILVAGAPRTGKTTLADALAAERGIPVRRTDDLVGRLAWSEASAEVARWLTEPGPWIIEGVASARALRKLDPSAPLPDLIAHLTIPRVARTPRQEGMAKGGGLRVVGDTARATEARSDDLDGHRWGDARAGDARSPRGTEAAA